MPFQPGNREQAKRKTISGGRPSRDEQHEILTLWQAIEREGHKRAARLANRYYEMAEEDPATMRHVVDGVRPKSPEQQPGSTTYQFIQFNNHHHTAQLPTEAVSGPVLVSDGRGEEAGGEVLASEIRQGQNGPKFHSFAHVPGKRR